MLRKMALGLMVVLLLAAWDSLVNAQSASWSNPATGALAGVWSNSANWNPVTVPGLLSTAQINNGGEARITSNVSTSRIEVGKNGGTGTLTSVVAVTISTDSDFDIGEIGGTFASGPIVVHSNGTATITDATSINIGTGGSGDLDIGQTSATSGAQAIGIGMLTLERVVNVQVAENVEIGKSGGSAIAEGQGTLLVDSVGTLQIGVDLDVGQAGGTGQATAFGMAAITNTPSLTVGFGIDVGRTSGSSAGINSGSGNLNVSDATISVGFADVLNPGSLNIGGASTTTNQVADAEGMVSFERVTLDVASRIKVGELSGLGTSAATVSTGTLNLTDSEIAANRLEVATVIGATAGTVQGTVHLDSSLVTLDSTLTLGSTSVLEFSLAGTTKSDGSGDVGQFSAIDADVVTLDGGLNLFLVDGFVPSLGDTFQILTGLRTGTFDSVVFPALPTGLDWEIHYDLDAVLLEVLGSFTADFDTDGDVDDEDLNQWKTSFGTGSAADADGDSDSDGNDFLAWQRQFRSTLPSAQSVPEPTTQLLSLLAFVILSGDSILRNRCPWRELRGEAK